MVNFEGELLHVTMHLLILVVFVLFLVNM